MEVLKRAPAADDHSETKRLFWGGKFRQSADIPRPARL
jgi:hypothetical protein